ncbi:MAG: hypothetical protein D6712_10445 [Chloroflexi bacterium]|nr:MAG: hypothetical protein D6712_10445 [Chloroflexota bacterium]
MNILGIGGWELVAIFIIMLLVAGPERMIRWAYQLGRLMAYLRHMWADVMRVIQEGLRESGIDIELPDKPPTRAELNRKISRTIESAARPVREPLEEVDKTIKQASVRVPDTRIDANAKPTQTAASSDENATDLGTWGNADSTDSPSMDAPNQEENSNFGTWSAHHTQNE